MVRILDSNALKGPLMSASTTVVTPGNERAYKRRQYVINPAFQWRYTLMLATGVFVAAALMGILLFGTLHSQARARTLLASPTDVWSNGWMVFMFALAFSTLLVASLVVWGILITHRVSGPMFVLQNHFRTLTQGRFPKFRPLRKRDEFKELHEDFKVAVTKLKDDRQADLSELTELAAVARTASPEEPDRQTELLRLIATRLDTLRFRYAESLGIELEMPIVPKSVAKPVEKEVVSAASV